METGGNEIKVPVVGMSSSRELAAQLVAGGRLLDEESISLHFVTPADVLPWAGLGVFVILAALFAVWYVRRRRKARRAGWLGVSRNFVVAFSFLPV